MKATLSFGEDDMDEFLECVNAAKMSGALHSIKELLRGVEKYDMYKGAYHEDLFKVIREHIADSGIDC